MLVQHEGLTEESSAALARAGGIGLLLAPASGWPICNHSALGQVTAQEVRYFQPWWMDTGLTGALAYNTTLVRSLGFALADGFLDYSWASVVDEGRAYTLDNLDAGAERSVHIRAIPAFVNGAFETTVSDTALVWGGKIGPRPDARFIVSGLNLANVSEHPAEAAPVAKFLFSRLVSYAVSEAAAALSTTASANALDPASEPPSFCVAGSEQACRPRTSPAGVCNANFEIAMQVHLYHDTVVDALHPRLSARGGGDALIVPVIYAVASSAACGHLRTIVNPLCY